VSVAWGINGEAGSSFANGLLWRHQSLALGCWAFWPRQLQRTQCVVSCVLLCVCAVCHGNVSGLPYHCVGLCVCVPNENWMRESCNNCGFSQAMHFTGMLGYTLPWTVNQQAWCYWANHWVDSSVVSPYCGKQVGTFSGAKGRDKLTLATLMNAVQSIKVSPTLDIDVQMPVWWMLGHLGIQIVSTMWAQEYHYDRDHIIHLTLIKCSSAWVLVIPLTDYSITSVITCHW
jgi:hypothetical protein